MDLWVLKGVLDSEEHWNYEDFQIWLSGPTAERNADVAGPGGDLGTTLLLNVPRGIYGRPRSGTSVPSAEPCGKHPCDAKRWQAVPWRALGLCAPTFLSCKLTSWCSRCSR